MLVIFQKLSRKLEMNAEIAIAEDGANDRKNGGDTIMVKNTISTVPYSFLIFLLMMSWPLTSALLNLD